MDESNPNATQHRDALIGLDVLAVDVETDPAADNRIFRIGAVRASPARQLRIDVAPAGRDSTTGRWNDFAAGARVLVGHNLRRHDLAELRRQFPGMAALGLPIIDTLEWSALAFPINPYHRLVKGYRILSDSRNDPVRDAALALDLLADELGAFAAMHHAAPEWLNLLHYLMVQDPVIERCLREIRSAPPPDAAGASDLATRCFAGLCCATRLAGIAHGPLTGSPEERFDIALALGWIRIAGGNSVLPMWVHHSLPAVRKLVEQLRSEDCGNFACVYCRTQHNPEHQLRHYFGHTVFRTQPAAADGSSLQRNIVCAGLARQSLLAVLPTGGGKSICYQLPALVHYWRTGALTVIVSPLQSLMKDQVDNLVKAGVHCAVTINGLLTPIERRAALDKIRLGDAGLVLVSPEQFRSRTFVDAIRLREIATWVFDEAHCLSKWGHDFRTDYLYVARFIREYFPGPVAPVACFTATAKPEVIDDLRHHFRQSLGLALQSFLGGHERHNLSYQVIETRKAEKPERALEILQHELHHGGAGIVFCATRKSAETMAALISAQGMPCGCFHGALSPEVKQTVQQRFLEGELAVISATNAFGMGVDKPDIRVVIHAEIPGSLENYLQEAGRAGRDGDPARCVLLFDAEDVETQFRLASRSRLTQKDFTGLLRAARNCAERIGRSDIVMSATELLNEGDAGETDIDIESRDVTTKVTTAIAWLERGGFLKRNENNTRVFPASLRVATLGEAIERINAADLPAARRERYVAVATSLFRSEDPKGISTDELILEAGIEHKECFRILHQLATLGIIANDLGVSVRLKRGIAGASDRALADLSELERALLELMIEQSPEADTRGAPQRLAIRQVCTELRRRLGLPEGDRKVMPDAVRACLKSMAVNFGSERDKKSLFQVRGREEMTLVLHQTWGTIRTICERRRAVAQVVLNRLLAALPAGKNGALVVECKARELLDAIEQDFTLQQNEDAPVSALEHALLYLHDNLVLQLDRGRALFRSAMTLALESGARGRRFLADDFKPLAEFYRERTLQTHVMHEYARLGMESARRAAELIDGYFNFPKLQFVQQFFLGRADILELATTEDSFRRIVDDLNHPIQQALVEAPERGNHLVLAGPGSGKTRVIVHRIAYLLRVRRVAPESIIALAFNRHAAAELRQRLLALAGEDARRVTVLTYHAMALRLTGTSLEAATRSGTQIDFDELIRNATRLLQGVAQAEMLEADDEQDALRDRLLRGYEYIFVDEYQDIDADQYELVSALAGRRQRDQDAKLNIMAVGDDDQNIYAFKGASVEYIRRFQADYDGKLSYLVENFRSTQHIIAAANHVIQPAAERMKVDHPIRTNAARVQEPPGGRWQVLDAERGGRVLVIEALANSNMQAQLVMQEIARIRSLAPDTPLGQIVVLARTHRVLESVRAACEEAGLRYELMSDSLPSFMQLREGAATRRALPAGRSEMADLGKLLQWLDQHCHREPRNPHWADIRSAVAEFAQASRVDRVMPQEVFDALYEAGGQRHSHGSGDAICLGTAHAVKGLEFDHVIIMDCADWGENAEDDRRLLYVAMTRARRTLTLMRASERGSPYLADIGSVEGVKVISPDRDVTHRPELERRYRTLGPRDIDLGYPGRVADGDQVHGEIAGMRVGDAIWIENRKVINARGNVVGRLASKCALGNERFRGVVTAVLVRTLAQTPPEYSQWVRVDEWEVPLVEVVLQ